MVTYRGIVLLVYGRSLGTKKLRFYSGVSCCQVLIVPVVVVLPIGDYALGRCIGAVVSFLVGGWFSVSGCSPYRYFFYGVAFSL